MGGEVGGVGRGIERVLGEVVGDREGGGGVREGRLRTAKRPKPEENRKNKRRNFVRLRDPKRPEPEKK